MADTLNQTELTQVIQDMTDRIVKVAELVDQVFPDKEVGAGIKVCADKLVGHVNSITSAKNVTNDFTINDLTKDSKEPVSTEAILKLAKRSCYETFEKLLTLDVSSNVEMFSEMSLHARDLLKLIGEHE